jgi:hypothetical protein
MFFMAPRTGTSSAEQKTQATLRLAVISLMNGAASDSDRAAALSLAEQAGVTVLEYLHAHLLLSADRYPKERR